MAQPNETDFPYLNLLTVQVPVFSNMHILPESEFIQQLNKLQQQHTQSVIELAKRHYGPNVAFADETQVHNLKASS